MQQEPVKKNTHKTSNVGLLVKLRNYLLTGLIIIGPFMITVVIIVWMINLIDSAVLMILRLFPSSSLAKFTSIPGFGVIVVLIILLLVGMFGANYLVSYFMKIGDIFIAKVPLIKPIYNTVKQIFGTIFSKDGKAFQSVVLVRYPCEGSWSIGFVTSSGKYNQALSECLIKHEGSPAHGHLTTEQNGSGFSSVPKDGALARSPETSTQAGATLKEGRAMEAKSLPRAVAAGSEEEDELLSVFIPTTPNPTSGFLLYVRRKNVVVLDMPANVAMKIIISGGSISASEVGQAEKQKLR